MYPFWLFCFPIFQETLPSSINDSVSCKYANLCPEISVETGNDGTYRVRVNK